MSRERTLWKTGLRRLSPRLVVQVFLDQLKAAGKLVDRVPGKRHAVAFVLARPYDEKLLKLKHKHVVLASIKTRIIEAYVPRRC